jgi:hypothetical protein
LYNSTVGRSGRNRRLYHLLEWMDSIVRFLESILKARFSTGRYFRLISTAVKGSCTGSIDENPIDPVSFEDRNDDAILLVGHNDEDDDSDTRWIFYRAYYRIDHTDCITLYLDPGTNEL